eukprot:7169178-Lingulodinium_polyedra.AAC.1
MAAVRKAPPKPGPLSRAQRMRASTMAVDKAGRVVKKAELGASNLAQQVDTAKEHLKQLLEQQSTQNKEVELARAEHQRLIAEHRKLDTEAGDAPPA